MFCLLLLISKKQTSNSNSCFNEFFNVIYTVCFLQTKTICYFYLLYVTILIGDGWVDDLDAHLNDATVTTPEMDEVEELDGFTFDMESNIKR